MIKKGMMTDSSMNSHHFKRKLQQVLKKVLHDRIITIMNFKSHKCDCMLKD